MFRRLREALFGKAAPTTADQVSELTAQLQKKLLESQLAYFGDNLVSPYEPLYDEPGFYSPAGPNEFVPFNYDNQNRGESIPAYLTEYGLKIIRDQARRLAISNEFAINAMTNRQSYIVGKGFQYTVHGPDELAEQAQAVLDEFIARCVWAEREREAVWRCDRDGEAFIRLFHVGRGKTEIRFVEPEWVRDYAATMQKRFGVITDPDDIENVLGYEIVERPQVTWTATEVPAEEVVHIKLNTDFTAKRGLPTLFAVRKNLERADKLLRNMSTLAQIQATFALIRKHKQYSAAAINTFQQGNADVSLSSPYTGNTQYLKQYSPGTILDVSDNTDYEFPAAGVNGSQLVTILQAELRAIAARLVMPEYMLTVDASNANYASTLVAEAPAVKHFEALQAFFARRFGDGGYSQGAHCGVLWRVLYYAVEFGDLDRAVLSECEIQAEGPVIVSRDRGKETERAQKLNQAGIMSRETWTQNEGLDWDQEQTKIKEEGPPPGQQPPGQQPPAPGAAPEPTPPGSAGGESADLFDFGESCVPNETGKGYHDDRTGYRCASPGGQATSGAQARKKAKAANRQAPVEVQQRQSVIKAVLATLGNAKDQGAQLARRLLASAGRQLSPSHRKRIKRVASLAKAVEHKAMLGFSKGKALAIEAAKRRGIPTENAERIGKIIGLADMAMAWTVNMPVIHAAAEPLGAVGSVVAGKVGSFLPLASLGYLTYSTARNPLATIRAARKVFAVKQTHEAYIVEAVDLDTAGLLADALHRAGAQADWYSALLAAAMDEQGHDLGRAIKAADLAFREYPEPIGESLSESCVPNEDGKGHHDDKTGYPCSTGNQQATAQPISNVVPQPAKPTQAAIDPNLHPLAKEHLKAFGADLKATDLPLEQKKAYFEACQTVLKRMSPAALQRFKAGVQAPTAFLPDTAGVKEELIHELRDNEKAVAYLKGVGEIGGAYASNSEGLKYLVLDGDPKSKTIATKNTAAVYAHEFGHGVDGPKKELSRKPEWQSAWEEEIKTGKLNRYAASSTSEGFAEFSRLLHAGEHDREAVRKQFPRCYAFWESRKLIESSLAAEPVNAVDLVEADGGMLPDLFGQALDLPNGTHADVLLTEAQESCVSNRSGEGHHDDQTGHPCSIGGGNPANPPRGKAGPRGTPQTKAARRAAKKARQKRPGREKTAAKGQDATQLTDAPIQRVGAVTARGLAEILAGAPGVDHAAFVPGVKPPDIEMVINGKMHGIEAKAFVSTKKRPLAVKMGRLTRLQKEDWEADHDATMHTVMVDHTEAWQRHGSATAETIAAPGNFPCFYRRGGSNGNATDPPALRISSPAELVKVMAMSDSELSETFGGRGTRPVRLKGSDQEHAIRQKGSKR
jgi:capsid protein